MGHRPSPPGTIQVSALVDAWTAAGNTDPATPGRRPTRWCPVSAIHPYRRLDYVMVSTPRRRGAGPRAPLFSGWYNVDRKCLGQ